VGHRSCRVSTRCQFFCLPNVFVRHGSRHIGFHTRLALFAPGIQAHIPLPFNAPANQRQANPLTELSGAVLGIATTWQLHSMGGEPVA